MPWTRPALIGIPLMLFLSMRRERIGDGRVTRRAVVGVPTALMAREAAAAGAGEGPGRGNRKGGGGKAGRTEFLSGLASGTGVSIAKQVALYPFDTLRTRLQVKSSRRGLFKGLYNTGIIPPLVSRTPASAVFFGFKDFLQAQLQSMGLGPSESLTIAVFLAQFPKWAIRSPSERLKTLSQAQLEGGDLKEQLEDLKKQFRDPKSLFEGYTSNIGWAFPHDAVKFVSYDFLKRSPLRDHIPKPLVSLVEGALAGVLAEVFTSPLDVTRTRVMSKSLGKFHEYSDSPLKQVSNLNLVVQEDGFLGLFAGLTPKLARAIAGGAIQFATIEYVKSKTKNALDGS